MTEVKPNATEYVVITEPMVAPVAVFTAIRALCGNTAASKVDLICTYVVKVGTSIVVCTEILFESDNAS